ncbi:MAG: hypothetical protein ACHQ4H_14310 [Ktedonobacterales bacterium]
MTQYLHFSIFLITIPNLIVIGLMLVVFALAVVAQLPHPTAESQPVPDSQESSQASAREYTPDDPQGGAR